MITAELDTSKLNKAISLFAKTSKKSVEQVMRQQAGIIVGHVIAITPPGARKGQSMTERGGIDSSARKRGESAIKTDINILFPTTRMKPDKVYGLIQSGFRWGTGRGAKKIPYYASSAADLKRIHAKARSPITGRIRTGSIGQNMALTTTAARREFLADQKKKVGILNAGWLKAARELKTAKRATPAWITRHGNKPGSVNFSTSSLGLTITITNKMPYFPGKMDERIQQAINRRVRGIEKALVDMLTREGKKFNQNQK